MSKRVENLKKAQEYINLVAGQVDLAYDRAQEIFTVAYERLDEQIAEAVVNEAAYEAAEQKAQEIIDRVKNFTANPQVKNFWDTVVRPVEEPRVKVDPNLASMIQDIFSDIAKDIKHVEENPITDVAKDEKIRICKEFYKANYGIDIWANHEPNDAVIDHLYKTVTEAGI